MALTLSQRCSPDLVFQVRSGLSIAYPFLYPTGTDTGNALTSTFDTSPYTVPSGFAAHVGSWLTDVAVGNGFDHIKLMVHPGPVIEAIDLGQQSRRDTLLDEIEVAVDMIIAAGLKCYINLHLTGFVTGYSASSFLDGSTGARFGSYQAMVHQFASRFANHDKSKFALELFNEPPDVTGIGGREADQLPPTNTNWASMIKALHADARSVMPYHTLIVTAGDFSRASSLVAFDPSQFDKNTLWAFHWYPLSSVQGYTGSDYTKWFDSADWEKRPDQRPAVLAQVTARVNAASSITDKTTKINAVMANYDQMLTRGRDYIEAQIAAVASWASINSVSAICSEYGVRGNNPSYNAVPEASRLAAMRAVSLTLAKYGIPRTVMAGDSIDFHIPGNASGPKTLDTLTPEWKNALQPGAGFASGSSS